MLKTDEEYAEENRKWREGVTARRERLDRFVVEFLDAARPVVQGLYQDMKEKPEWQFNHVSVGDEKRKIEQLIGRFFSAVWDLKSK